MEYGMLRFFWTMTLVIGFVAAMGPLTVPIHVFFRRSDFIMGVGRVWSRMALWACGARVRYHDLPRITATQPCIYLANHQSNVDVWVLLRVLPRPTRFVAKQSLFRLPFLGWALGAAGFIPIDRKNKTRAIRSLNLAAVRIRDGRSVVLFPEGTRSRNAQLQPFKKGPFHLALRAGVPIVPVAIAGGGAVMPAGAVRAVPGDVDVFFLEAIEVAPYLPDDIRGLQEEVHRAISGRLNRAGKT